MKQAIIFLLIISWQNNLAQNYKFLKNDSINVTDINDKKQGHWIIYGKDKRDKRYGEEQKVEEGYYKDNLRTGIWTDYHPNENIHRIMTYVNGKLSGKIKIYYETGEIKEEGEWQISRWVGVNRSYTRDGVVTKKYFDSRGRKIESFINAQVLDSINDPLTLLEVKKYFFKETGAQLFGSFYTFWKRNEDPYFCLFVSEVDTIQFPINYRNQKSGPFTLYNSELDANIMLDSWEKKGFQAFIYKTYANSSTRLNGRFLSYTDEAKCFIMYHELMHNYVSQKRISISYDIHEALCDLIGNYGTLNYARVTLKLDLNKVYQQTEINEKVYESINKCISKINKLNCDVPSTHNICYNEVQSILKSADTFQKDRFDYKINNGYRLKNSNYCKNYFLLKKILEKQGSIIRLLEIIKELPEEEENGISYLEKFIAD